MSRISGKCENERGHMLPLSEVRSNYLIEHTSERYLYRVENGDRQSVFYNEELQVYRVVCKSNLALTPLVINIIISLCNSFSLYSQAEGEPTKMTYYEPSEWDEDSVEVERYEEEAGESVLRSERDIVLSRMNHGIQQVHLELNNLL